MSKPHKAKKAAPSEDHLDKDLLELIAASFVAANKRFEKEPDDTPAALQALHQRLITDELMQRLVTLIVRRDHLVKDSGMSLGISTIKKEVLEIIEKAKDADLPLAFVKSKTEEL